MKLDTAITWIFGFIIIIIMISIFLVIADKGKIEYSEQQKQTYEKCCGGNQCSDTYYDSEKNVCVLSLCKNQQLGFWGNRTKCEYNPK